jgi:hypothetical protein
MQPDHSDFQSNPPGTDDHLTEVETHFGCTLPLDYRRFMAAQDGGEGFVGTQYLVLWRASELVAFNHDYQVEVYAPGLLLFGSNGGGEAFAFDTRDPFLKVVMVPFVGMSLRDAMHVADSFDAFLTRLSNGKIA